MATTMMMSAALAVVFLLDYSRVMLALQPYGLPARVAAPDM